MGAGEYYGGFERVPGDLVIAADGGIDHLAGLGIEPDIIIGDFDSAKTVPSGDNVISLPREKNDTDTLAAIKYGLERGFVEFGIWGGTGGRADHTAANIQTLVFLSKRGARGFLYGDGHTVTAVTDGCVTVMNNGVRYVSVFSHSDLSRGVTISGLFYSLDNASITNTFPIGVSNTFTAPEAEISVRDGTLVVYLQA